jgi:hypothetical protein
VIKQGNMIFKISFLEKLTTIMWGTPEVWRSTGIVFAKVL